MAKKRNIIVGQSGGPTAVINSSLAGVYKTAKERGFHKVYGMLHGIEGLLDEMYVDLSTQIHSDMDIELLKRTPSAFLGSCRYKLPDIHENPDIYEKIFSILDKLDIEVLIYIGGNDSMDTIKKLSDYAIVKGHNQKFLGVPKTIDNDLALTDHTPGFGSAAKYIASITKEVIRDGLVYDQQNVTLLEIMGRNAGWLTGAAALAKGEDCEGPDMLLLVDEVQTGVGRTGSLFAFQQYGVQPDVISFAKGVAGGLPFGGIMANEKCRDVFAPGTHGTTFGGNPVAAAAACYVLDRIDDAFLEQVREKGAYLRAGLEALEVPCLGDVRGMGLMLGVQVKGERTNKELAALLLEHGLLCLTAGPDLRLLPPLVITREEMDKGLAIMKAALS